MSELSDQEPPSGIGYPPSREFFRGELETEKGLKHLSWGIGFYIIAMLLIVVGALLALNIAISGIETPSSEQASELVGIGGMICGGMFLIFLVIVLWLLGLYEMNLGKREFGPEHSSRVKNGIVLILAYIVLMVVNVILQLEQGPNPLTDSSGYISFLRAQFVISGVFSMASTIALSLAIVNLVHELCTERYKRILWAAFSVSIVISALGLVLGLALLYGTDLGGMSIENLLQFANLAMLTLGLAFIPFILFFFCYRHAYNRVSDWEIKPHQDAFPWIRGEAADEGYPLLPRKLAGVCPKCGTPRYEGEKFCANCGTKFKKYKD